MTCLESILKKGWDGTQQVDGFLPYMYIFMNVFTWIKDVHMTQNIQDSFHLIAAINGGITPFNYTTSLNNHIITQLITQENHDDQLITPIITYFV